MEGFAASLHSFECGKTRWLRIDFEVISKLLQSGNRLHLRWIKFCGFCIPIDGGWDGFMLVVAFNLEIPRQWVFFFDNEELTTILNQAVVSYSLFRHYTQRSCAELEWRRDNLSKMSHDLTGNLNCGSERRELLTFPLRGNQFSVESVLVSIHIQANSSFCCVGLKKKCSNHSRLLFPIRHSAFWWW